MNVRVQAQVIERSAEVSEIIIKKKTDDNRYNRWKLTKSMKIDTHNFYDLSFSSISDINGMD